MDWRPSNRKSKSTNPFDQDVNDGTYSSDKAHTSSIQHDTTEERQLRRGEGRGWRTPVSEPDGQLNDADFPSRRRYRAATPVDAYSQSKLADDDGERQIDNLKSQIRNVKQDTLESTRNALQTINASEEMARNTLSQLGEQASQIANVDRQLGVAKDEIRHAAQQATHLKKLNRSIFIPAFKNPFQRKARAARELEEAQRQFAEACSDRDAIGQFEHQSKARTNYAQRPKQKDLVSSGRSQSTRNRYQFEPDQEDDAIEDEIDQNLDSVGNSVSNLKEMALAMRDEIDSQNEQLEKITDKVDPINEHIFATTHRINKIK